ncbi:MAG: hypothetical protein R2711_11980 [Acidimicrobiales bacterium]
MWPATFGLACCAIEMMGTGGAHCDLARFGMEVFGPRRARPTCQSSPGVSQKMAPVLRQIYDQMMEPKWVISMGVCASSGGMFNNYAIVQGTSTRSSPSTCTPQVPARPRDADPRHRHLHEQIRNGELFARRGHRGRRRHHRRSSTASAPQPALGGASGDRRRPDPGRRAPRRRARTVVEGSTASPWRVASASGVAFVPTTGSSGSCAPCATRAGSSCSTSPPSITSPTGAPTCPRASRAEQFGWSCC